MYLKLVDLHGFKTFAERTSLQFGPGVTAVVGPNGSGKSNIADAIQWALGEQSLKSLRSGNARDIIFAGSDGKRPVGLAEVTVTFDNADRVLPLDFSEVTVTRRVHRSGDGEFLINRIPCRLRDIQELFLDTGVGKEAYSVINQTEIDAILSIRSEDRRELIEEVAGIKKYRVRKREAERRLDHTRTNLIRVTDVINELEQQVEPLARQSEQARRYQEFSTELTGLRRALLVDRFRGLLDSQTRIEARLQELTGELEQVRAAGQAIEASEQDARTQLAEAEALLEQVRASAAQHAAQAADAEREAALRHERLAALADRRGHLEADLEHLRSREAEAQAEIARTQEERERLTSESGQLSQRLEALQARLAEAEGGIESRRQEVEQAQRDYLACLDETAGRRNALTQAESLLESARRSMERLAERRDQAQQQAEGAEAQVADLGTEIQRLESEHQRLRQALAAARTEIAAASTRRDESRARLSDIRERLSAAAARRQALEEMAASAEGHPPAVRAVIQAAREGTLAGEYRLIPELLSVAPEHERAVEAALGPAVDFIVTGDRAQAAAAVSYLNTSEAGRAAFLPLADLRAAAPLEAPAGADLALDLIECDARYRPAFEQLLGQVLVAPDLEAALGLADRLSGWRKIVTLRGDVIYPSRAICGGSPGREARLIGRRRELEELAGRVASLEGEASAAAREVEQASSAIARLRQEADQSAQQLEALAGELESRRGALRARQAEAEQARAHLADLAAEMEALERDIAENGAERERAAAEVAAQEARQAEAGEALKAAEEALSGARGEHRSLGEELSAARLGLTERSSQASALQSAAERAAKALEEIRAMAGQRAQALEEVERTREATAQEAEACASRCRELATAREQGEAAVAEAAARRDGISGSLAQGAERRKAQGQQVEDLQARHHRADLRATQIESEIGYVKSNLWDDHRIEADAALAQEPPLADRRGSQARAEELEAALAEMGLVNLGAVEEYERVSERLRFLTGQRADLEQAREDIQRAIAELDETSRGKFMEAFEAIGREFDVLFRRLFGGGATELLITDPERVLDAGIDVHVQLPGKRPQNLLLLSGGERALTALALLLAMLQVRPSPFVILDEIDAPLDATNVGKYTDVLREFARRSQFIVITHNPGTMEAADALHGVTMERPGVSTLVSVRLAPTGSGQAPSAPGEADRAGGNGGGAAAPE